MKKTLGIVIVLLVVFGVATLGLAADQSVNVIIPAVSELTINLSAININFLDTWTTDTQTATSGDFNIETRHNGSQNPDITVSTTPLSNGTGQSLDLTRFIVYVTPHNGTEVSGALNQSVTISDIGRGRKTATAHYGLTIDTTQQSGTYTGTVTYTLVNQ